MKLTSTFDRPLWREAVVIKLEEDWVHVAVRAKRPSEVQDHFSSFTFDGKCFFMVELKLHQLQAFHGGETCLSLGVSSEDLVREAGTFLESDPELIFATASEPEQLRRGPKTKPAASKTRTKEDSSASSSSSQDSDMMAALTRLGKSWQGGGTDNDDQEHRHQTRSKDKKKEKFSLLKKDKERDRSTFNALVDPAKLLKSVEKDGDPIRALLTMQLAEKLERKMKHRKNRNRSRSSSESDGATSSRTSSHRGSKVTGHAKAIARHQASKKKMFKKPLKYVRQYVEEVEAELGADGKPYHLHEFGKRINWGKQRSLQKVHYLLSQILSAILQKKYEESALQTVLALRAVHQACLDQGDWSLAWLLTHQTNVWERRAWGGTAEELGNVAAYLKSMDELSRHAEKARNSHQPWNPSSEGGGVPSTAAPKNIPKKGKKGQGKGKDEDKQETSGA